MGFWDAKPTDEVIKKLEKEKYDLLDKILDIDSIFSNDTDISQRQLNYMSVQNSIMNSLVEIIDVRIDDLKESKKDKWKNPKTML